MDSITELNRLTQLEIDHMHKSLLRNELNPHFLFNAMNSISMRVRLKENPSAVEMIAALNDLLRASLRTAGKELIPLQQERDLLEKYLIIERARFEEDRVTFEIARNTEQLLVPELLLQPILENAFKHARLLANENTNVKVSSTLMEGRLIITIFNNSNLEKLILPTHNSIGLPNVISRLRRHYGLDFQFHSIVEDGGIAFKINIPAQ